LDKIPQSLKLDATSFQNFDTSLHVCAVSKASFKVRPIYHQERTPIPIEQEAELKALSWYGRFGEEKPFCPCRDLKIGSSSS